jgi:chemotaxis family two-component system response regulator Rcp1
MDVLRVEDSPGDIRLAQEAFRDSERPVRLHVARDGVEAMAFLRNQGAYIHVPPPQLILLDLNIPMLNGREVLAQIKADKKLKVIAVIVLSTSHLETDIQYCYQHHASCYIRKPEHWEAFDLVTRRVNEFWLPRFLSLSDNAFVGARAN